VEEIIFLSFSFSFFIYMDVFVLLVSRMLHEMLVYQCVLANFATHFSVVFRCFLSVFCFSSAVFSD
ncbi:MAG: hypothetical protein K2I15_12640, partial [Bacteroides sp.]|nr:hypothetical protein [Bacteroides sp.]